MFNKKTLKLKNKLKLPLSLIVLDAIGTILLGLGLYMKFGQGDQHLGLNINPMILIILGVCLMLPIMIHVIRFIMKELDEGPRQV